MTTHNSKFCFGSVPPILSLTVVQFKTSANIEKKSIPVCTLEQNLFSAKKTLLVTTMSRSEDHYYLCHIVDVEAEDAIVKPVVSIALFTDNPLCIVNNAQESPD